MERYNSRGPYHAIVLVAALTVTDAICTAAGLRLGVISEENPLLSTCVTASPELTGVLVCGAVGVLLLWLYSVRERVRWITLPLAGVAAAKLAVLGLHFAWMIGIG